MDVRSDEKRMNDEGITYQRAPNQPLNVLTQNAPTTGKTDGWRLPTSAESSDGSTTQGPGLKRQKDTVNGSANASVPFDRKESRHQGDFTPNFKFGGEIIKTEVRADEKRTDRDGHTSQRVQNRPLDPLTRNVPPTGKNGHLEGDNERQELRWGQHPSSWVEMARGHCKRVSKAICRIRSKQIALSKRLDPQTRVWRRGDQNGG